MHKKGKVNKKSSYGTTVPVLLDQMYKEKTNSKTVISFIAIISSIIRGL